MRSQAKDSGQPRVVSGTVLNTGVAFNGVGFTSVKTATGQYIVRFLRPFKGRPVTSATAAAGTAFADVVSEAADSLGVSTYVGTTLTDSAFNFVTTGYD
jgi:hypothetical protein